MTVFEVGDRVREMGDAREGVVVSVDREGRLQDWVEVRWEDGDQEPCSRRHLESA